MMSLAILNGITMTVLVRLKGIRWKVVCLSQGEGEMATGLVSQLVF